MLIDHYFYEENWVEAINAIQLSMKEWGNDGTLNTLLAEMLLSDGKINEAIQASKRAIQLEPENEAMYWAALNVYNTSNEFESITKILTLLKDQFSYEFDADEFRKEPEYLNFTKSDAFKAWFAE